ncbi:MAG: tetratricopeptide repeat protein [Prevotellaceae bacterium]|jgi:tetratricopeptide (TPR) repeat protein|nr:tetratricopeptide repeat protein [Prevotellaceae bacterium]
MKTSVKLLIIVVLFFTVGCVSRSRDDEKVRAVASALADARAAFDSRNYSRALEKVAEIERLTGSATKPATAYIKIMSYYRLEDYENCVHSARAYLNDKPAQDETIDRIQYVYGKSQLIVTVRKVEQTISAANMLDSVGRAYYDADDFEHAEQYWLEAKSIREKALGKEHHDYFASLSVLGWFYLSVNHYAEAEKYWLEAKAVHEKTLGKEYCEYAAVLDNLGTVYGRTGDYAQAEKYWLESLEIWERVDKEHPSYTITLNNLGLLYSDYLNDSVKAEKYNER